MLQAVIVLNVFFIPVVSLVIGYGIKEQSAPAMIVRYAILCVINYIAGHIMAVFLRLTVKMDVSLEEAQYTLVAAVCAVAIGVLIKILKNYFRFELDVRRADKNEE